MRQAPLQRFIWSAHGHQGQVEQGAVMALNAQAALQQLRQAGWLGIQLRQERTRSWLSDSIRPRDITLFTRQLATMVQADVPILAALSLMIKTNHHTALRHWVEGLHRDISAGLSLSQALSQQAYRLDSLYLQAVSAGEASGAMGILLERLASHREKQEALASLMRSALVYPIVVLCVALSVTVVVLIWVVPTFETAFSQFGATLPWPTRWLLNTSHALVEHGLVMGLVCLLLLIIGPWLWSHSQLPLWWDRWTLHWPWIGRLRRLAANARWTSTLGTLLDAGLPLNQALMRLSAASGNRWFDQVCAGLTTAVQQGQALNVSLQSTQVFDPLVVQLCCMGEASGTLAPMLAKSAALCEHEVEALTRGLTSLIEPLVIVFLGLVIGAMVLALYWPMFELGHVMG